MGDSMTVLRVFQFFITFMCAAVLVYTARLLKTPLTISLFSTMFCVFMVNTGYLLVLLSSGVREVMNAIRVEYVGSSYAAFSFMLFMFKYVRVRFPEFLKVVLFIWHTLILFLVFTWDLHNLYYDGIELINGLVRHGNGIFYNIEVVVILLELFVTVILTVREIFIRRKKKGSRNYLMIAAGMAVPIAGYIAFNLHLFGDFDTVPSSEAICAMFFVWAIARGGILSGRNVAHERIIKTFEEGVVIADKDLRVIEVNDNAKRLFPGLSEEVSKPLKNDELLSIYEAGGKDEMIIDGRVYRAEVQDFTDGKRIQGHAAMIIDMTDEYERLRTAERLKEEADTATRKKSEFLAGMSHEIRTPINAVLGMNEMIMRESRDDLIKAYSLDLRSAASSLLSIVNNILDMSKIEEGKMVLLLSQYDLTKLTEDVKNILMQSAVEKGLLFITEVDEKIPQSLYGDDLRLRQSLNNLLSAAIRNTEKGAVTLSIEETAIDDEEAVVSLYFRIGYTGELPDEEDLKITLSKAFIALMGSAISFENEGEISVISFEIKQGIAPASMHTGGKSSDKENPKKEEKKALIYAPGVRVLVCDDNPLNLKVFKSLLSGSQMEIDALSGGEEVLEKITEKTYHIIFLDHMMPELDGVETLHRMKTLKGNLNAATPVIVLTANAVTGAEKEYLSEGFNDYLSKPVDMAALTNVLERFLPNGAIKERPGVETDAVQIEDNEKKSSLPELLGFDWDEAREHLIEDELIKDTLLDFYGTIDDTLEKLDAEESDIASEEGLKAFRISAHTLKSMLRTLGAKDYAALCEEGEGAAAKGLVDESLEKLSKIREMLLEIKAGVAEAFGFEAELSVAQDHGDDDEMIGKDDMIRLLSSLKEALLQRDYDRMDSTAQSMKHYAYPDEMRGDVLSIIKGVDNIDINGAVEATEGLLQKLKG